MVSERIKLNMTVLDVVMVMAGGNPGAIMVCMQLMLKNKQVDPDAFGGELSSLLMLDSSNIYEERIYMLWNDVCKRDIGKTIAVLRAHQLDELDTKTLNFAIDNRGAGIDLNAVVKAVKKRLPNFNPEAADA